MAHVAGHAQAYAALLAPHQAQRPVSALLHLLAAHGQLEDALPGSREATSYLRLLTAIAARVIAHKGGRSASSSPPELLVGLVRSMAAAAATMERLACSEGAAEGEAAAGKREGGGGRGPAATPTGPSLDVDARWHTAAARFLPFPLHPHAAARAYAAPSAACLAAGHSCGWPSWPPPWRPPLPWLLGTSSWRG